MEFKFLLCQIQTRDQSPTAAQPPTAVLSLSFWAMSAMEEVG